jgi:hypothetical protein
VPPLVRTAPAYTFTSTARNAGGTSAPSAPSPAVSPALAVPGVPGTPTAVGGDGQATVTITAPSTGGAPDSYLVTASGGGATCTVTSPATSCVVSGLTNGIAYTFTTTATNTAGTSGASPASNSVTPVLAAPGVPGAPSAVANVNSKNEKKSVPSAEEAAAVELVRMAKEQGLSLTGPSTRAARRTGMGRRRYVDAASNGTSLLRRRGRNVGGLALSLRPPHIATSGEHPITFLFNMNADGFQTGPFVARDIDNTVADVTAKCPFGLLTYSTARTKSFEDDAAFAEQEGGHDGPAKTLVK